MQMWPFQTSRQGPDEWQTPNFLPATGSASSYGQKRRGISCVQRRKHKSTVLSTSDGISGTRGGGHYKQELPVQTLTPGMLVPVYLPARQLRHVHRRYQQ